MNQSDVRKKEHPAKDYQHCMLKVLMYPLTRFKKTGENECVRSH